MKRPLLFIFFLFSIIMLLSVVQVVVSNRLSTTGLELAKMQEEIRLYKNENALLSERLLAASSLTQIASKAAELGFVEAKSPIVISAHVPIAVKQ